jgi:hypothetical protein
MFFLVYIYVQEIINLHIYKNRAVAISYTHRPHALDKLIHILSLLMPTL